MLPSSAISLNRRPDFGKYVVLAVFCFVLLAGSAAVGQQQDNLSEPVYRVANEPAAQPVAQSPIPAPQPAAPQAAFDFARQGEEHPLAPVLRVYKQTLDHVDQNVRDYSCTFVKQERLDGDLGEQQHIAMRSATSPSAFTCGF